MSYQALYRKFRPDNFEDVKGQDHIVTTLKNQIKSDHIGPCVSFLRDTRNRKNDRGENLCQSSKLRKPRRKRTLRRVCHVPFHRRGIFDERDRDGCRIQQ